MNYLEVNFMFIYSLRASTLKFFGVITISVLVLITLIAFIPTYEPTVTSTLLTKNESITFDKIKSNDDRMQFIEQFGWKVESQPLEEAKITIPSEFDKVFIGYNELQKQQGLNLSKYKNKDMMRYTYIITNYPAYDGIVYANIVVYRNKVVAGDVCSADVNGFIHGFSPNAKY